ncbi:MAG: ribosome hibernation-promoting factor, HPF/YfiA family [Ignavibacteriales bacterium]
MQVNVSGKNLDVGEALRSRVSDDLSTSISKYFERGGDADVVVQKDGHGFRVDCSVTLASGRQLNSHGLGGDAYSAFGDALAKIDKRIRRYKRRLKDHSEAANAKEQETAALYVLRTPEEEEETWDESSGHPAGAPSSLVIAETAAEVRTMTVAMAVMELDLTDAQAIVFRNAAHGGLSVVYRRPDGNIGWVDPERTRPAKGNGSA